MRWFLEHLLGVDPATWAEGGRWRVELLALPRQDRALLAAALVMLGAWGVWYLYRREGRTIGLVTRWFLASLRLVVLAAVLVMLLEPVLVFTRQEWVPSNLLVLRDASESMDVRDAYPDAALAERVAAALALPGKAGDLRKLTRSELARRVMDAGLADHLGAGGDRNVKLHDFTAQLLPASTSTTTTPSTQPSVDRSATAIGAAIRQAISAHQGQPVAGILLLSDGQSNTGEPPAKAAEFAAAEGVPVVSVAL